MGKRDGETRFCIDYRKLNAVMSLDVYLLPHNGDCLEQLAGPKYVSTLDLNAGFWQVGMELSSQEKTVL